MKKAILLFIMALTLLFSCKKDHSATNPLKKTYQVNFNVSGSADQITGSTGSKQQVTSLQTNTATALAASIDILYYYVFDSDERLVSSVRQDSTEANLGTIVDNLAAGSYTVVFAGGKTGINLANYNTLSTANIAGYNSTVLPWHDTFFKEMKLTVSTSAINQSVVLQRIVGELSINILDQLPTNAHTIKLTVNNEFNAYSFSQQAPYSSVGYVSAWVSTFTIPASAIGKTNYKNSMIMMNTTTPFTATIACYDASNKLLAQSVVNNVSVKANTNTILTGDLFGSNSGFTLGLQPYDPNPLNTQF